jgi:type VI protein secretion system component Hcp
MFGMSSRHAEAQKQFLLASLGTTQGSVRGTSNVKGHEGWLEVESAMIGNLAFTNENSAAISSATAGGGKGKITVSQITITRERDSASPLLMQASTGHKFSQLMIEILSGSPMQARTVHRLTITGGTMMVKSDGPGKEAIIFVGGNVVYR